MVIEAPALLVWYVGMLTASLSSALAPGYQIWINRETTSDQVSSSRSLHFTLFFGREVLIDLVSYFTLISIL